ncbi:MAG: hypothetical protein LBS62_13710 [Clostridiales bacterium]|jgi:hypothetical protein|nr:hypothetical protein [Clostridiales bacterium]
MAIKKEPARSAESRAYARPAFLTVPVLKNLVIIILGFTAVYLTCLLWFDKISNRDFISTLAASLVYSAPESAEVRAMIAPYRIMVSLRGETYGALYSWLADTKKDGDAAIELALKSGEPQDGEALSWESLLKKKAYIYEYAVPLPADMTPIKSQAKGSWLIARMSEFDMIIITPELENIIVTFVNTASNEVCSYTAADGELSARIAQNISLLTDNSAGLYYVPSTHNGGIIFVPHWRFEAYPYSALEIVNPYMYQGDLLIAKIEKKIESFFSNPALIVADKKEAFIYNAGSAVVKYLPNDTVEYFDYSTTEVIGGSSFAADYHAALDFASKDSALENEFRMHSFKTEDGQTTFYFDYFINNFPLILPEKTYSEINMRHPIEITVQNRKVIKYRKLAYVFKPIPLGTETADFKFNDVMGYIRLAFGSPGSINLNSLELGYKFEMSTFLRLNWFLGIDNQTIVYSAKF